MDIWKVARYSIGFAVGFALLFVGLGLYQVGENIYVVATAPTRPGVFRFYHTVRRPTTTRDASGRTRTTYSEEYLPVYHYTDPDGRTVEVDGKDGHLWRYLDAGDAIEVLVPHDPDRLPRINGFVPLYLSGIVTVLVGALFAVFFLFAFGFVRRLTAGRDGLGQGAPATRLGRRLAGAARGNDERDARDRETGDGEGYDAPGAAAGNTVERGRRVRGVKLLLLILPIAAIGGLWLSGLFDDADRVPAPDAVAKSSAGAAPAMAPANRAPDQIAKQGGRATAPTRDTAGHTVAAGPSRQGETRDAASAAGRTRSRPAPSGAGTRPPSDAEVDKAAMWSDVEALQALAGKGHRLGAVKPSVVKSLVGKGGPAEVAKLRLLLEAGFDPSQIYARQTFGDQAVSKGKTAVARLIRDHGGRFDAPAEFVALVIEDEESLRRALAAAPADRRWRGVTIDGFAKRLRKIDLLERARVR